MAHLRSVSRLYSLLTVRKSRLIRYKHGSQTSLEGKFEGSSLCVLCVFSLYFYGFIEAITEAIYKWFHFQVSPVFDHCTCYIITTSAGVPAP